MRRRSMLVLLLLETHFSLCFKKKHVMMNDCYDYKAIIGDYNIFRSDGFEEEAAKILFLLSVRKHGSSTLQSHQHPLRITYQ